MSDKPIVFYELASEANTGGPWFSPHCFRARLAFALKGVPIETVEVDYPALRHHWTPKLGVDRATAPFVQLPDGTYLVGSFAITDWLEDTFPDRPSLYLPEAPVPVDFTSDEYRAARAAGSEGAWEEWVRPLREPIEGLYARLVTATLDPDSRAYWIERAGGQDRVDHYNTLDRDVCIAAFHAHFAAFARELDAEGWQFFQSATRPGIKDLWLFAHHRQLAGTSRVNARDVYERGPLAEWTARMEDWFAEVLGPIAARDPE